MPKYLIGWSFDYSHQEEQWCDPRIITAATQQEACSLYVNCNNTVSTNPIAVLHVKEIKHVH